MYQHMKMDVICLRLDTETSTIVEKLIEFNMVKKKTGAVKFVMKKNDRQFSTSTIS